MPSTLEVCATACLFLFSVQTIESQQPHENDGTQYFIEGVDIRAGFCDAPFANNEVRPETLETSGSERFGVDFVPKENIESQRGSESRRNPRSNEERRVACRVHRCYRRGLVSITFPAGWPSRRALEARLVLVNAEP
jgi:hypothetical protein